MKIQLFWWRPCQIMLSLGCLLSFQPAIADELLPTMTITEPKTSLSQHIGNSQTLNEEDISIAHERSIADVLQGNPGITLGKFGGFGQDTFLMMRGAGGHGLITLDDIPLIQSSPGFFGLDTLPPEALGSAEIDRGPGAAFRSFQALGGAIRLYTQDRKESGVRFSIEGGSFGILRENLQGSAAGSLGRMTLTLSHGDAFDGNQLASAANNPERERFHFTQGILRFATDITPDLNWQGSLLQRKSKSGSDTLSEDEQGHIVMEDDPVEDKESTWLAQSTLNYKASEHWNSHLQLGFTQWAIHDNADIQTNIGSHLFLLNWRNEHSLINNTEQQKQWQINWGAQGRVEHGESSTIGYNQNRTMLAGFLDSALQVGKLSVETGIRLEHFNQYGDHPLFKVATAYSLTPHLTLRASGGTGYRLPSYSELLYLIFGNVTLQPEYSSNGELGLEWDPLKNLHVKLNGFYHRYHQLISPTYGFDTGPSTQNIADASVTGLELDAQYAWTEKVDTGISYTYNNSRNLNTHQPLPFRPENNTRIWGSQRLVQLPVSLWAELLIYSRIWNDLARTIPQNGAVQLNVAIRYHITSKVELYLRGENLSNNRTPLLYSTNTPGAAVYGGLQVTF